MRAAIGASILFALLLAVLVLSRGGGKVPVGTFRGERDLPASAGADPVVAAQLRRVQLRLDDQGNAVLEDGGIAWEGRATRSGENVNVEVLLVNGVNIDRQPADFPRTLAFRVEGADLLFGKVRLKRS